MSQSVFGSGLLELHMLMPLPAIHPTSDKSPANLFFTCMLVVFSKINMDLMSFIIRNRAEKNRERNGLDDTCVVRVKN